MRRFAIALAAAGCCLHASAQSTLQIYGTADVGVTTQSHRPSALTNSVWNPSQLGFKGQEDLGGGLKAFFDLGTSISFDTGTVASTKYFDRNAFVGLSGNGLGALAFGRQLNTLSETFFVADPLGTRNGWTNLNVRFGYLVGPGPTIVNNFGPNPGTTGANLDRVDNAVKYLFRSESTGISGAAMVAMGEHNGGGARGALLGWDRGPLRTRVAFMDYHDAIGTPLHAYAAGVSYGMTKAVTLRATYTRNAIDSDLMTADRPYGNMATSVGSVGAIWAWSPRLNLTFAYYRGARTQDDAPKMVAQKFYFVPEYFLSKRTSLYLVALRERFNATGSALDTATPLPTGARGSTYAGLGISHSF